MAGKAAQAAQCMSMLAGLPWSFECSLQCSLDAIGAAAGMAGAPNASMRARINRNSIGRP
jgi:hypothetical protein